MHLNTFILSSLGILFLSLGFGQDTSRVLTPVPVFAQGDSILRVAVISSTIPHFQFSIDKLDELGATDVGEALKFVPGVQMRDYGGIGGVKTVSYRSLGAAHTAVQIDGTQIPNVQSGTINLSNFELFGLKQVAFSSGQVLADNATATAYIQANTIALTSLLAEKPNKMRMGLYTNITSINAYENGGYFQHKIGKHFYAGVQGMVRFGQGTYAFVHPELVNQAPIDRENTALLNYKFKTVLGYQQKGHQMLLSAAHRDNQQELPGAAVLFNPSNDQKLWNKDSRVSLNHQWKKKKWRLQSNASYQSNYTRYYDPFFLNLDGFIDAVYQQQSGQAGIMFKRSFRFPNERIFIGTDVLYNTLDGNNLLVNPERFQSNSVIGGGTVIGRFRIDGNLSAQFITDHYAENKALKVARFSKVSPFLSVAYLPFKKHALRFRTFYKNTYRMPTFNDLYYNFIGNTQLKPEDATLFNFGLTYGISKKLWSLELTTDAYYNEVKNKIVAIPTKDLFNWSMQNIGRTQIKGTDIGLLFFFKIKDVRINLNTNHSFNESIDVTDPDGATFGDQIPYTPYYSNTSGASVSWKGYKISSNVLFNGFRFSLNENIYANLLPAFTDINIGLSKTISFSESTLLCDLKVMNILNKNYQVIRSFPVPGRYFQLRIKYTLEK